MTENVAKPLWKGYVTSWILTRWWLETAIAMLLVKPFEISIWHKVLTILIKFDPQKIRSINKKFVPTFTISVHQKCVLFTYVNACQNGWDNGDTYPVILKVKLVEYFFFWELSFSNNCWYGKDIFLSVFVWDAHKNPFDFWSNCHMLPIW